MKPSAGMARSLVGGTVSLVVFVGLAAALVTSTRSAAAPPGWTWRELEAWFDRQPVGAAFSAFAVLGLVVVLYLIVSTVGVMLAEVARLAHFPRVGRVAEAIAVPCVRRTLAAIIGLGLTVANPGPAHAAGPLTTIARMTPVADPGTPASVATMHSLAPAPTGAVAETSWTIRAGDHLWGLAASALAESGHTAPTDDEVIDYLAIVIEHNRATLAVPAHPDLVFPGQVFVRPPIPVR
jgi:hypothetical protein